VIRSPTFYREPHSVARDLRDVLIEHLDGRQVPVADLLPHSRRRRTMRTAVTHGLIEHGWPGHTVITERGREELSVLLADYAEALTRVALLQTDELADRVGLGQFPDRRAKTFNRESVLIPLRERTEGMVSEVALSLE
jgi:hypothetical protein